LIARRRDAREGKDSAVEGLHDQSVEGSYENPKKLDTECKTYSQSERSKAYGGHEEFGDERAKEVTRRAEHRRVVHQPRNLQRVALSTSINVLTDPTAPVFASKPLAYQVIQSIPQKAL
jgi:hypothetical protein